MPEFAKEIYLQGNLKLNENRTVRDPRFHLTYKEEKPGPTQRPNNSIPLLAWLKERIEEGDIEFPTFSQNLNETLQIGNATDGESIFISDGDLLLFDNYSAIRKGTTDAGNGGNKGVALVCSLAYELKWEAGRLYIMDSDGFTIREVRYNFSNTPDVIDDDTKGYVIGSRWILDNGDIYECTDNTTGAAVWDLLTPTIENIYTTDGELEEDRTITGAGYFLKFEDLSSFLAQSQFSKMWLDLEEIPGFFNGIYSGTGNILLESENWSTNTEPAIKIYAKESKGSGPAGQLHFSQHEGPSEALDINVFQYNSGTGYPRLGGGVKMTSRGDAYGLKLVLTTNTNTGNDAVANDLDIEFVTGRATLRNLPTDNTATQILAKDANGRLCWRDVSSL